MKNDHNDRYILKRYRFDLFFFFCISIVDFKKAFWVVAENENNNKKTEI